MGETIIAILSVIAFSMSFRFLLASLSQNIRMRALVSDYSMRALRMERVYKIASWSFLCLLFFVSTVVMTYQIYHDLGPLK
jgi:hypothetical protein